jgi:Ca2+-binding EF-hand superfamily protein
MKINRNNYEAFFIDYLEGFLDEKLVDDFIEFLQQNPDLKEELSLFQTVSIGQEEITFSKKESLLKEKYDVEHEFNQAAIASMEGDISASEKTEFEKYLSIHPEKQKEAGLFNKTKLQPDKSVVFSKKNKLYRYSAGRTILLWTTRVAAILIIALSVYIFIDKNSNGIIPENQVAVLEKEPEKKINPSEIKEIPTNNNKVEEQKTLKKETIKPAVKSEKPKANETKIIRENSQGRLINDGLALVRISEEIPALQSLSASVTTVSNLKIDLVPVNIKVPDYNEPIFEERLFVDIVKEKTGVDKLSFNKIVKSGLSLVASLSKEKFNYETDKEGKVTEVSFDSRLLAFSIPTRTGEGE